MGSAAVGTAMPSLTARSPRWLDTIGNTNRSEEIACSWSLYGHFISLLPHCLGGRLALQRRMPGFCLAARWSCKHTIVYSAFSRFLCINVPPGKTQRWGFPAHCPVPYPQSASEGRPKSRIEECFFHGYHKRRSIIFARPRREFHYSHRCNRFLHRQNRECDIPLCVLYSWPLGWSYFPPFTSSRG